MANFNTFGIPPTSFKCGGAVPINSVVMLDGTTAGQVVVTSGTTSVPVGVAMETGATGDTIPVQMFGVAKCIASTSINANAWVMCNSSGNVTTATGAVNYVGIALTAAGTGGADVVEVLLQLPAVKAIAAS